MFKPSHILFAFLVSLLLSCGNQDSNTIDPNLKDHLYGLMQEQQDSWNAGDIEGFMKHYWHSDSLQFVGSNGLKLGWVNTLEMYKKSYPNKEAMGQLKFEQLSFDQCAKDVCFIIGKWHLERGGELEDLEGLYSLVWKRIQGNWVITSDHSS